MMEDTPWGLIRSKTLRAFAPHGGTTHPSPSDAYAFHHRFCFFLHDTIAALIRDGEKADIFTSRFTFKNRRDARRFQSLNEGEEWDWLLSGKYRLVIADLVYKQVTAALLSDLCHFVFEALQCARKGKYTVAYALLRKPFCENLLYLEWLLADPADFLICYLAHSPADLDMMRGAVSDSKRRVEIIGGAIEKLRSGIWISPAYMLDLRYSDNCYAGFSTLFKRAIHLVTTHRAESATEPQNLNFVFSTTEAHVTQARHFYSFVPLVLFHVVEIAEALIGNMIHMWTDQVRVRRLVGFALWAVQVLAEWGGRIPDLEILGATTECPRCRKQSRLGAKQLADFYEHGGYRCARCHRRVSFKGL